MTDITPSFVVWLKLVKCKDVSLETKTKIIYTMVHLITAVRCENWIVKKANRKAGL